ncbi:MAG: GNAT family N-acetyltransferase [Rhodospirillales bacterium]|nr:GNAT family N-acetyltransferase [Rhodospirillales bacterium]
MTKPRNDDLRPPFSIYPEFFRAMVESHGDTILFTDADGRYEISYRQIGQMVDHGVAALNEKGLMAGDRVLICLPNSPAYFAVFSALICAGCIPILGNPENPNPEIEDLCKRADVKLIIASPNDMANRKGITVAEVMDCTPFQPAFDTTSPTKSAMPAESSPDDTAYIIFSGGTSGRPKGCRITHANILAEVYAMARAHDLPDDCTHLCILPMYHASALYRSVLIPFSQGSKIVIAEQFKVEKFWHLLDEFSIGFAQAVPSILTVLVEHPSEPTPAVRDTMHFIGSASAPLAKSLIERFENRFGIPVAQAYGLTEATCGVFFNDPRLPDRRADSPGRPIDIASVEIRNEEGKPLPAGQQGEIVISGPMITAGYIEDDLSASKRVENQILFTEDVGFFDENGYLVIEGRKTDIVHRGGFKVSPTEIESALNELDGVLTAVVFGIPHETLVEDLIAMVRPDQGGTITENQILDALHDTLAPYKIPSRIGFIDDDYQAGSFKKSRQHYKDKYMARSGKTGGGVAAGTHGTSDKPQAFLVSENTYLRPLLEADVSGRGYMDALMDPEIQKFTFVGMFPQNEESVRSFWAGLQPPNAAAFAICDLETDAHVGNLILRINWPERIAEFGRFIFPDFQGGPYSEQGMLLLMGYVFDDLKLKRLWGGGVNPASVPSLVRLGFTLEGTMRKHVMRRGEWLDTFMFGMLDTDYGNLKKGLPVGDAATIKREVSGDLEDRVLAVVAEAFSINIDNIAFDSSPADLRRWDSLGVVRLWSLLEEHFNLKIESSAMVALTCVADIVEVIASRMVDD